MNEGEVFHSKSRSNDIFNFSDRPMNFYQQDTRAAETKPLFSEPVYNIKSLIENPPFLQSQFPFMMHSENVEETEFPNCTNNAHFNTENCLGATQEISYEASFMKNIGASINSYVDPAGKMLHQFRSSENASSNDAFSCFPKSHQSFGDEYSSSKKTDHISGSMTFLSSKPGETILSFIEEKEQTKNNYPSSENDKYPSIPNVNILNAAHQLLSVSNVIEDGNMLLNTEGNEQMKNNFPASTNNIYQFNPNVNILNDAHQLLAITDVINSQGEDSGFRYENDGISSNELVSNHIDMDCSSGENSSDHYIENRSLLNITVQLLTVSEGHNSLETSQFFNENEASSNQYKHHKNDISTKHLILREDQNKGILNTDFTQPLSTNEISEKYRQFYKQTCPQDYDFAMNIMAYIEALNDCTWHATVTYFDEIVKNMVRYLWNKVKNTANSNILLDRFDKDDFLNVMEYFTEFAYQKEYQLGEFIQYCILMCQLGVLARNRNFKDAPLHVIDYLQKGISKIEHEESITFEIDIKNYARELSERM